jgi:hypothetical protein
VRNSSRREGGGGKDGVEWIAEHVSTKRLDSDVGQYFDSFLHIRLWRLGMLKSIGLALASVGLALTVGLFGTTSCICLSFTNNGIHDSIPHLIPKLCHTALPMVLLSTHKNTRDHTDKASRGLSTDGYISHLPREILRMIFNFVFV